MEPLLCVWLSLPLAEFRKGIVVVEASLLVDSEVASWLSS